MWVVKHDKSEAKACKLIQFFIFCCIFLAFLLEDTERKEKVRQFYRPHTYTNAFLLVSLRRVQLWHEAGRTTPETSRFLIQEIMKASISDSPRSQGLWQRVASSFSRLVLLLSVHRFCGSPCPKRIHQFDDASASQEQKLVEDAVPGQNPHGH